MTEFYERARLIHQSTEHMLETVRTEAARLLEQMDDADDHFQEQAHLIASLQETARAQKDEIEAISKDYEDKIDRRDAEITALRSRLNQKDKDFAILARAVRDMMRSAKHLTAVGAHALNIINRDAVADKIVTGLRGHPQLQRPAEGSLAEVLDRAGEQLPTERQAAAR